MALMSSHFRGDQRMLLAQNNAPPLKRGHAEYAVRLLQQALEDLGYPLPKSKEKYGSLDGEYGGETRGKVWEFQKDEKLKKDGVAGKNTITKMDEMLVAKRKIMPRLPDLPPDAPGGFTDAAANARLFILDTLGSSPLRNSYFTIEMTQTGGGGSKHSVTLAGFHYQRVAEMLYKNVIEVRHEPAMEHAALYVHDPRKSIKGVAGPVDANTFVIQSALRRTLSDRSKVIHEATHAACDVIGKPMNALFSEMVAFIMEAIYYRKRTGGAKPSTEKAYAIADEVAQYLIAGKPRTDDEKQQMGKWMDDLGLHVKKHPEYGDFTYGEVQYDGIP